ncbi:hypothetical protein F2Q70_00038353 [Brassica cretica]|uniref:Uncharacterized protein n=1 Tax=Brassica cretica TaxID=69181 RepID=A0A8S9K8G8_BRACR|nr:hypothetical protein F2Q70_00038353 [Brassica cretica]
MVVRWGPPIDSEDRGVFMIYDRWFRLPRDPGPLGNLGFPNFPNLTEIDGVNFSSHNKIAVRNNAGKTTPAATAPMANAYVNATVLEKIENLAATFRHRKCNETSSRFLFLNIKGNDKSYQTPEHGALVGTRPKGHVALGARGSVAWRDPADELESWPEPRRRVVDVLQINHSAKKPEAGPRPRGMKSAPGGRNPEPGGGNPEAGVISSWNIFPQQG